MQALGLGAGKPRFHWGQSFGTSSRILGMGWVSLSPAEPPGHGKAPLVHIYSGPLSCCACPSRSVEPPAPSFLPGIGADTTGTFLGQG